MAIFRKKDLTELANLHIQMIDSTFESLVSEYIDSDDSNEQSEDDLTEMPSRINRWLSPIYSSMKIDGAGWFDSGRAIEPWHRDPNSDWASELVSQHVQAPYTIRKSIREYVHAIDKVSRSINQGCIKHYPSRISASFKI